MREWVPTPRQLVSDIIAGFVVAALVAAIIWLSRSVGSLNLSGDLILGLRAGEVVSLVVVFIAAMLGFRAWQMTKGPKSKPGPAELISFVNAWMMPTWQKALEDNLLPIRGEVKRAVGSSIEALLQLGIIDPAVDSWRSVQAKLAGEGDESLDALSARMYDKYELIVEWIWAAGDMVNLPSSDSRRFKEWQVADEKFLDRLRELVSLPKFKLSRLAATVKEKEDGGKAKQIRHNLAARPASGREGGVG